MTPSERNAVLEQARLQELIRLTKETMQDHRTPDSGFYNECDTAPCQWCENARVAIESAAQSQDDASDGSDATSQAGCNSVAADPIDQDALDKLALDRMHTLVEQLAYRFRGYLPWPDELRTSIVRGHEMFIEDTIKKADALIAAVDERRKQKATKIGVHDVDEFYKDE